MVRLIASVVLLVGLTLFGRWLYRVVAPFVFWGYVCCVVALLGSWLYNNGIAPALRWTRKVDERIAQGNNRESWASHDIGRAEIAGFAVSIGTTMFGRRGLRRCCYGNSKQIYGYGLESRYFRISVDWMKRICQTEDVNIPYPGEH